MGGPGLIRILRPTARLSAVAALLAALFVCLNPHGAATARAEEGEQRRVTLAVPATEYSCPHDRGDCGLFPYLTPAVLTAPPLDPPQQPDALAGPAPTPAGAAPVSYQARPRAPDLHVLQVSRT
ncbi:hypothetical protein C6N75_26415 [Streptomyces solincola]|uniref:Secreted protein n=1 Tax=Streptomyces solincola TaxID=2100817 RepID=A0A2S9PPG5_9ACTN|nr:hypothetical protein [Streptomyces solincola]PRH76294.1 hypothetical protein C6N75_26415 [Streptomyces solincola]